MALTDSDVQFVDRCYGKNYVRLLHVRRERGIHFIKEFEVNTALTLNDTRDYLVGDNSQIVATDSQKNTVYILAKKYGVKSAEEFAVLLSKHFLNKYDHVTNTRIYIEEKPWQRIEQGGVPHHHAFVAMGVAVRNCFVHQARNGPAHVSSGLKDMKVMKTTQSAFKNFIRDEYRALPDAEDRIFSTVVDAKWDYVVGANVNYDGTWNGVKNCILDVFAGPPDTGVYSPSVQKTLYDTAKLVLSKMPQISKIGIELPNVHYYEFDLKKFSAFGFTKNEEVFQPGDKPSGNIKAVLQRNIKSKI